MPLTKRTSPTRTKRAVADLLKCEGPQTADELASSLSVSAMAVRQHLYQLESERLVTYVEESRPVGRPVKVWRLTAEANRLFPDAHAELAVDLIASMSEAFGADGVEQLLKIRARRQAESYREQMPKRASLRRRVEALARIRTNEGYLAEAAPQADGSLLLIENHCPICAAATTCTGLCAAELEVFQEVLGNEVAIERTEHLVSGGRRCAYAVSRKST